MVLAEVTLDPERPPAPQQPDGVVSTIPSATIVSKEICEEISLLLVSGVSTDQSKQASKQFSLSFEEQGFSLMPPKLDGWMSRRAKEKGVSKC